MAVLNLTVNSGNDDNYQETNGNANHITETSLQSRNFANHVGFILRNVTIAQGATIDNATVEVQDFDATNLTLNVEVYAEDVDDPANLATGSNDLSARTLTTAHVTWSATLATSGYNTSPDVKTVIQEVIDRVGWVSGNDILIMLVRNSGTAYMASYNSSAAAAPKLNITYSTGGGSVLRPKSSFIL